MLRAAVAAGTSLGKKVQEILDSGKLVPDDTIVEIVKSRIAEKDCAQGYILDGFPRTVPQAEALSTMLQQRGGKISCVVLFEVSGTDVKNRLDARRTSESRADDNLQVQLERLRVYQEQTAPLIKFYHDSGTLLRIDGSRAIDQVQTELFAALKKLK